MPSLVTIERHIIDQQRQYPNATGTFTQILQDMALAAKIIAREARRAGLVNVLGAAGTLNASGEMQQKLDIFADQIIFKMNDHTGRLCVMASEEHEDILPIPPHFPCGRYALVFDPLDGSGNPDVNASIGTIFALFRKISSGERGELADVLQSGRAIAAAGYIVYGPSTMMVYSTGQGVHGFTLDSSLGEFILSHPDMRIPSAPRYYSTNQGNERHWTQGVRNFVSWLQAKEDPQRKPLDGRYMGALVADFHRILLKGGIYLYPGNLQNPAGKLRLIYECAPLAYLIEQAGGYASDGLGNILDIQPHTLHQRVPLFIGDRSLVEQAERFIQAHDAEWIAAYRAMRESPVRQ
ncbi:MAG: class 1 fructose-bisphosphatase [Candidatus Thermofonsia Clade 1 bacterium]|uniref:Fructose-1,6-bisphosphatase class 1 n=1 Tax=Candidatus Thermofonsia Clade 1 bacterium TaxID=2364210 RepID=A0A2M8Q041_9CHLR|nr:MAG: class 1 fructose-bisphosphatase [Candidatus Thermofonsia Clade 1 bacterium]